MIPLIVCGILLIIILASGKSKQKDEFEPYESPINPQWSSKYENHKIFEVVGVHVKGRKSYINRKCSCFDPVTLKHEENNIYSSNAVVVVHDRKVIGYIKKEFEKKVLDIIQNNYQASIEYIDNLDEFDEPDEFDDSENFLIVTVLVNY